MTAPLPVAGPRLRDRRNVVRLRGTGGAVMAAVMGAAPHVLHHARPLAGAALLAGATGTVLFGVLGLALTVPMLMKIRRHTGSWRAPAGVLAAMAAAFSISSFVVTPALTDDDGESTKATSAEKRPGHDGHHPRP